MAGRYKMICASIVESSMDKAVEAANSASSDLVEVRLDYLKAYGGLERLGGIKKPAVATCMPVWEGGRFKGSEKQRMRVLSEASSFSDYVSIELRTDNSPRSALIKRAQEKGVKVIVAYHDFEKTPAPGEIKKILVKEERTGADVGKIAFLAQDYGDVLRTMQVLLDKDRRMPVIALSMGDAGRVSRILGPLLGSYMTFASPSKGKEAAPGQLTVDELKKVLSIVGK